MKRNLAIGYFFNAPFQDTCIPWKDRIAELFFAWPGILSCRPAPDFTQEVRRQLLDDLRWARQNGMKLDTLFNCNCYGELAISRELENIVLKAVDDMARCELMPDIVTTTSPFIAEIFKRHFPEIKVRASVNMRICGTLGFEAVSELFDEFYLNREHQRNLEYVRQIADWAQIHGKKIGMQVNSGCIRDCPFQIFHDNLHGHNRPKLAEQASKMDFSFFRCHTHYARDKKLVDILKATWIRPEDTPLWEPYVSIFKLATRKIPNPGKILQAYASYDYSGNLLDLLDPVHTDAFGEISIDNKSFPTDWATCGIANECAINCTHCGKCEEIFRKVAKSAPHPQP